jgi:DNA repair protein RecO (recombination protein O)
MLHKTRGIVLKTFNYSETSLIVHVLTEKFGTQSYLLKGVRKNKTKIKMSMLQPLHLLDMVVYHKPNGGLQSIAELKNDPILSEIPYNIIKTSLAIFICELLYVTLKESNTDEDLFEFAFQSIQLLDLTQAPLANFHLFFMLRFSKFLGIYPAQAIKVSDNYFDVKNGVFVNGIPSHPVYMEKENTEFLKQLMQNNFEQAAQLQLSSEERKKFLQALIAYYQYHLEGFRGLQSHVVLEEVLSN